MTAKQPTRRVTRSLILLAGIILGQAILYGPSLAGKKILLPLDILAGPGIFLSRNAETRNLEIQNVYLSDLIYVAEPARRFAFGELRAGRLPSWAPYEYCGAPFIMPRFSPFFLLQCGRESPVLIPWVQLLAAVVAGCGAYQFCRRVLTLSFWPSTVAGWCYPLTGFFVLWQGYPTAVPVLYLPWILLAVDRTVHGNGFFPAI